MSSERLSWWTLYADPALLILAVASVFVAFTVVIDTTKPADFHVFWDAARAYRQGLDSYTGYPLRPGSGFNLNPPAAMLLFLPFSFLPLVPAFILWTMLELAGYLLAARWIAQAIAPGRTVAVAAAVLASQATYMGLHLGQVTGLVMLLLTAAWLADRDDRPLWAGVLLGAAIAFKLFLGVFLGYALWRRSKAFVVGLATGGVAVTICGFLVAGTPGYRSWTSVLGAVAWAAHLGNASLMGMFTRELTIVRGATIHFTPMTDRPDWVNPIWMGSAVVVVGLAAYGLVRTHDRDRAWAITLLAGILISPLGWVYYAPLTTGPLLAVAQRSPARTRVMLAAGYVCFLVPYAVMAQSLGISMTLALGGMYTWGFALWFIAVMLSASRDPEATRRARALD